MMNLGLLAGVDIGNEIPGLNSISGCFDKGLISSGRDFYGEEGGSLPKD